MSYIRKDIQMMLLKNCTIIANQIITCVFILHNYMERENKIDNVCFRSVGKVYTF